jgi:ADP-ribose pyrophosphatase YjhB (NUDIX family)
VTGRTPNQYFEHCPRCGARRSGPSPETVFVCAACGFTLHFSAANSATAFILDNDDRVLLIRRAVEPAKGRLAPPGGFIDIGERAEDAARREVREEVGLELTGLTFLCSQTNNYLFKEVIYPVLDCFFVARAVDAAQARALDDVASLCWLRREDVDPDELAFPSMAAAWRLWINQRADL